MWLGLTLASRFPPSEQRRRFLVLSLLRLGPAVCSVVPDQGPRGSRFQMQRRARLAEQAAGPRVGVRGPESPCPQPGRGDPGVRSFAARARSLQGPLRGVVDPQAACVAGAGAGCRQALEAGAGRGRGGIGRDVVEVGAPTGVRAADAALLKIHARRARQGDAHDGVVDGHELVQRRVADGAEGRVGGMEQERGVRVQKRRTEGRKEEPTARALRDGAERAPGLGGGDAGQLSSHFHACSALSSERPECAASAGPARLLSPPGVPGRNALCDPRRVRTRERPASRHRAPSPGLGPSRGNGRQRQWGDVAAPVLVPRRFALSRQRLIGGLGYG